MFAPAGIRAKSKPSPQTSDEVRIAGESADPVVLLRKERPRREAVRVLVGTNQQVIVEPLSRLRQPIRFDEGVEALRQQPA